MPHFKVAHVRQEGADLLLIPLDPSFGLQSKTVQDATIAELQKHAAEEDLRGTVIPVWSSGGNHMAFIAQATLRPFLQSIGLTWVNARATRALYW